jgi:hypothetical protein
LHQKYHKTYFNIVIVHFLIWSTVINNAIIKKYILLYSMHVQKTEKMGASAMWENYRKRYSKFYLIGLLVIALLLKLSAAVLFAINKADYTEMNGVVVEKYMKRRGSYSYRSHYRRHSRKYVRVQYTENGDIKTAELRANFWETEGNTIRFYLTPNGKAVRNTIMDSNDLYLLFICILLGILILIKNRSLREKKPNAEKTVVGTVIDDYDFILDRADEEPANHTPEQKEERLKMPVSEKPPFELYTEDEYRRRK